jgi:uncharacterized repeat protein (TIGR01451 family)
MNPSGIEWSLSAPPSEADPKSFPAVAIHLRNETTSPQTLHLHFDLGPLRSLSGPELEVALEASEEKTVLYTLHVPPEAPGGSAIPLRARANDGTEHGTSIRIKAVPNCKATAESVDTRFVRPGEKAAYKVKIVNTGNIPLHCAVRPTTSPPAAGTSVATENLIVPVGGSAEAAVEVATGGEMTDFTPFVTSVEINTAELSGEAARQFLYFHTEAFPQPAPPDHTHLFETLKGSVVVGVGGFLGIGEKHIALSWDSLTISDNGEKVMADVTKESLKGLPDYRYADPASRGTVSSYDDNLKANPYLAENSPATPPFPGANSFTEAQARERCAFSRARR